MPLSNFVKDWVVGRRILLGGCFAGKVSILVYKKGNIHTAALSEMVQERRQLEDRR